MSTQVIHTPRLELIALAPHLASIMDDIAALAHSINAEPASDWPPEFWDETIEIFPSWVASNENLGRGWGMWLVVLREPDGRRTLIGDGGLKGEPTIEGRVDVGYSICASHQCKGFASEMLNALCTWAFEHPEVTYIVGETLPDRPASMRVLEKCGFAFAGITTGHGGEQQVLRYERSR